MHLLFSRNRNDKGNGDKSAKSSEPKKGFDFLEEIPEELEMRLRQEIQLDEELKVALSTDMTIDGKYGKDWLLATEKRLLAFNQNGKVEPDFFHVLLSEVDELEVRKLFGNNIIKVRTKDKGAEIARFSKSMASKFDPAVSEIQTLIQKIKPDKESQDKVTGPREGFNKPKDFCSKCRRPLPEWSGGICPHCVQKRKMFSRLLEYLLPYWHVATIAMIIMFVLIGVRLVPMYLQKSLFDDVLIPGSTGKTPPNFKLLAYLAFGMIAVNILSTVLGSSREYMMAWVGQHITLDLRNKVYNHLHTLSLSFFNQRETGIIMTRVTRDVERLQEFIARGFPEMVTDTVMIMAMGGIMFRENWWLALFTLIPMPVLIILTFYFGHKMHKAFHIIWKRWAEISGILADTIPGVRVVKAFVREKHEVNRFNNKARELFQGEMNSAKLYTVFRPLMGFITFIGTIIIWFIGGGEVLRNPEFTIGALTVFQSCMMQFYAPVQSLAQLNERFQHAATSAERVFEILDNKPEIADKENAIELPDIKGHIQFKNVTFSYDGEQDALDDVSFDVQPGEMIGLAGHTGAGKTTLINLLCRFYDINKGAILVDGHDIRDIKIESLRSQIGVVLQNPFLFNGTVAENIAYGKPGATMREVIAAAKAANAHEFIMNFPDGYDTVVGERGERVSGGERQRISIARAILKDPRILILDEATSSVDTETESTIQEALVRLIKGRTVFAIAHRLSTLKHSNRLLILEKGKLAEIGTHNELIEMDGIYAKLCKMQTELSKIRAW
jgi:ATP-binding cassette subfamily B protein